MAPKTNKNRRRNTRRTALTKPFSRIPPNYPRAPGDTITTPFKFTGILGISAGSNTVGKLLVLGKGTSTGDYIFLNSLSAQFLAMAGISSRWMITDLSVQVRATGIGGSSNTFIAASYIPSDTGIDNPPTSLAEVSQAVHYAESSLGTTGNMRVRPTDYYNDWKQANDTADDSDRQVGLIQLYGSGTPSSEGVTAGVYTISGTMVFCGFRV